jgi:hypothetical protein
MSAPLKSTSPPTTEIARGDLRHDVLDGGKDLVKVDHRDVRELGNQVVLESGPGVGAVRPFERRDEHLRRVVQDTGAEHEHEAAIARVFPVDPPDAGDPGLDLPAEDVEPHRVAQVDREAVVNAFLDRHFRIGRAPLPEPARRNRFVCLQTIAVGHGVLARQRASRTHVLECLELRIASGNSGDARAQHGNQPERTGASRWFGEKCPDPVHLPPLDVHQEHVGRIGSHLGRELLQQA